MGRRHILTGAGLNRMVLGGGKREQIDREPLLNWYSTLFREASKEPRSRLLTIGYGFRDRHINEVLVDAIKIWQGVTNYFQSSLREMFPSQDQAAPQWARVQAFLAS